jgi:type IV secretion system protein VirB8
MKNNIQSTELETYMTNAKNWETDKAISQQKSERRAWFAAFTGWGVAALACGALVVLTPLKTTVPYMLYVDKASGNTEVVNVLNNRDVNATDLNSKHWAKKYVIARENYLYSLLQLDYDAVLSMSTDDVGGQYAKAWAGENSKDKKLGAGVEERIKVISVVLPPDQVGKAVVRYEKATRRQGADVTEPPTTYVATLAYEFKTTSRGKEKDLIDNPWGFKVTSYRVDTEIAAQGVSK